MTIHHDYIGCDISKESLDVHDGSCRRLANEGEAIEAFVAGLDPTDFVVFEATGPYDRLLRHALARHGIAFARLNPMRARRFAEACGRLAKTDRLDARMLRELGARLQPPPETTPGIERERLAAFARRRDQLVEMRARQRRHLQEAFDAAIIADIGSLIEHLDGRIAAIEAEIERLIRRDHELGAEVDRLVSAPGVGRITALTLIAHMPELGRLSPKTAASLAGLAPFNNDSGKKQGRRAIRGGRPRIRRALYMAALGAMRASSRFKLFYRAVAARSGSRKAAIIAVARKLITVLNAMMRDKTAFA